MYCVQYGNYSLLHIRNDRYRRQYTLGQYNLHAIIQSVHEINPSLPDRCSKINTVHHLRIFCSCCISIHFIVFSFPRPRHSFILPPPPPPVFPRFLSHSFVRSAPPPLPLIIINSDADGDAQRHPLRACDYRSGGGEKGGGANPSGTRDRRQAGASDGLGPHGFSSFRPGGDGTIWLHCS